MKYPIITINHQELVVNLMDAEFITRLADANTALQTALSEAETEQAKVTATGTFFDAVFGPGTTSRIFKYYNELVGYTDITPRPSSRHIKGV